MLSFYTDELHVGKGSIRADFNRIKKDNPLNTKIIFTAILNPNEFKCI